MKNLKARIALGLVFVLVVLGLAYEEQIRRFLTLQGTFDIARIPLVDVAGRAEPIDGNYQGYVIFYSDLVGCSACMRRLGNLAGLDKAYPGIGFYAIVKNENERKAFAEKMLEYDIPGQYLVDDMKILEARLRLGKQPMLLFFTRERKLFASIPMDVKQENLKVQIHRYINEL